MTTAQRHRFEGLFLKEIINLWTRKQESIQNSERLDETGSRRVTKDCPYEQSKKAGRESFT